MNTIEQIIEQVRHYHIQGKVVDYIPILKNIDLDQVSISIIDIHKNRFDFGDIHTPFSIQSISKVLSFIVAAQAMGLDELIKYVDLEPTGDSFNSIIRLESSTIGKPFNPLINAGAITTASLLPGYSNSEKIQSVLALIEKLTGEECTINEAIYQSEEARAYKNRAIAYYLKETGFIEGTPEDALEVYLKLCSVEVTTNVVAQIGLLLANDGLDPHTNVQVIDLAIVKAVKALMVTCGMYNYSGKHAALIGIPSKSGVSGGILCALRHGTIEGLQGPIGIGIFSPAIDDIGNSIVGIKFLEELSKKYNLNMF